MHDRQQGQQAERDSEQQRQVLDAPEVHQVGRRGRALHDVRAEPGLPDGEGIHPGLRVGRRPEPDQQGVQRRGAQRRRQQATQAAHGEGHALAEAEGIAQRGKYGGADDRSRPGWETGQRHLDDGANAGVNGCERVLPERDLVSARGR